MFFKNALFFQIACPADAVIKDADLYSEGVTELLSGGMVVEAMRFSWNDQARFLLAQPYCLKSLKFDDQLIKNNEDMTDILARLDADMVLMVSTLRELYTDLGAAFGGWEGQEYMDV